MVSILPQGNPNEQLQENSLQELEVSLYNLETILDEFYSPYCTNDRRKQIDDVLSRFFQQQTCLPQALYFLKNSHQDYTRTFAINILQACVCYNWPRYDQSQQLELRNSVRQFLFENAQSSQYYVLNKLCKLIADIARCEWPEKDAEYFNYVMSLIHESETQLAGLTLLRATFEEFITPRESISVARRSLLVKVLLESVPNVIHFLVTLLQNLFQSREKKYEKSLISECLQTLIQMFSWIPLANNLNNALVMVLLSYCHVPSCASGQPYQPGDDSLSLLAMDCVNEIMAKKCVPKDMESFLLAIFQHTMAMIAIECEYPESFLTKLVFFLQLLASSQFARFEALPGFPLEMFLNHLLRFTFRQTIPDVYLSCLDIWTAILDHLKSTIDKKDQSNLELFPLYKNTVVDLNSKILAKVTFAANSTFLDELDDEILDDDKETEYEKFQRINLEVIVSSSDIYPQEILSALHTLFTSLLNDFKTIVTCIHEVGDKNNYELVIKGEYDNLRLHCKLRDLATICRLIGMVNGTFFTAQFQNPTSPDCLPRQFVNGLMFICKTNLQYSLFKIEATSSSETLHSDFSNLLALSLGALQLMLNWISAFLGQAVKLEDKSALNEIQSVTEDSYQMAHGLIESFDSSKIVFGRLLSQIVFSHSSTVKAAFTLRIQSFYNLVKSSISSNFKLMPIDVQCKIVQSICCGIISSWAYSKDLGGEFNCWESRVPILSSWISELFQNFHMVANESTFTQPQQELVQSNLSLFSALLQCLPGEVKKTREICLQQLEPLIEDLITVTSNHFTNPVLCGHILDAYNSILECLKSQLGPDKTSVIVTKLVNQLTTEKVQSIFCQKSSDHETEIISKFIKTLMRIAEEPSKRFIGFLPGIISFVCDTISPLINQDNYYSPDCITTLLDLLFQILKVHWSKFFDQSEDSISPKQFVALINVFGQCLLFPDINVYKHAINALQRLNEVFGMYNYEIFREKLRNSFLMLLMSRLLDKTQLLNEEETLQSVYSLALVDFANFKSFLSEFFTLNCSEVPPTVVQQMLQTFQSDTDYPTFSTSLTQITAEMCYYKSLYAPTDAASVINFTNLTQ